MRKVTANNDEKWREYLDAYGKFITFMRSEKTTDGHYKPRTYDEIIKATGFTKRAIDDFMDYANKLNYDSLLKRSDGKLQYYFETLSDKKRITDLLKRTGISKRSQVEKR